MSRPMRRVIILSLILATAFTLQAGYTLDLNDHYTRWHVDTPEGAGGRLLGKWFSDSVDITPKLVGGFWCVDIDSYATDQPTTVDVTSLGSGWNGSLARKGNAVYGANTGNFRHQLNMSALERYRVAAALIGGYVPANYGGFEGAGSGYTESGDRKPQTSPGSAAKTIDIHIQDVIWYALDVVGGVDGVAGLDDPRMKILNDAVKWVKDNPSDSRFERWLLFSPPSAQGTNQAFLAEVPEPGFLAFLACGLTGLYLYRRRRLA